MSLFPAKGKINWGAKWIERYNSEIGEMVFCPPPATNEFTPKKKFYFDTRKQAKKFCLEKGYPLSYISINTD